MRHATMKLSRTLAIAALVAGLTASVPAQGIQIDEGIPTYEKQSGISGNLTAVGSDTLVNLMTLWSEQFRRLYPGARAQIEGKGSSTAPPALIEGVAQLGPMSRRMKATEVDRFEKAKGYKPTAVPVAIDGLAVFIHKDNPLERLTLEEVDAIFSKTRTGGHGEDITRWGQVGLDGSWEDRAISLFGRNSASGTYGYFKKKALFNGDYKDMVKEQPGSASVVQGVAETLGGIGYSGIGYKTSDVRTVALSKDGETYYAPVPEDVYAGRYLLARFLYIYVDKAPNRDLPPLVKEYLRFALSRTGQEVVVEAGYLPLKAGMVEKSLEALGATSGSG